MRAQFIIPAFDDDYVDLPHMCAIQSIKKNDHNIRLFFFYKVLKQIMLKLDILCEQTQTYVFSRARICFAIFANILLKAGQFSFFISRIIIYMRNKKMRPHKKNYSRRLRRKLFDIAKYKLRAAQSYDLYMNIFVLIIWILCGIFVDEQFNNYTILSVNMTDANKFIIVFGLITRV